MTYPRNMGFRKERDQRPYVWRLRLYSHSHSSKAQPWHPTPVLLPGKSHGRRSLVGFSPWGRWGLDTTERLHFHFSLSCIGEGNGNPLQCSCLENPRDGEAWWAAVYRVTQSRTRLKWLSSRPLWSSSLFLPEMLLNPPLSGLATRRYTFSWTTSMTTGGKDGERFYFRRMCKARGSVPVTRGIWLKILKSFHYPPNGKNNLVQVVVKVTEAL